jgi:hypothetical protein
MTKSLPQLAALRRDSKRRVVLSLRRNVTLQAGVTDAEKANDMLMISRAQTQQQIGTLRFVAALYSEPRKHNPKPPPKALAGHSDTTAPKALPGHSDTAAGVLIALISSTSATLGVAVAINCMLCLDIACATQG